MRDSSIVNRAVRWMARLLRLYPAAFRETFAADMLLTFRAQCREVYVRQGTMSLVMLSLITSLNVLWEAGRERTQLAARFGALAWIIGGALWAMVHSPLMLQAYAMPIAALLLLLIGLTCL